MVKVMLRADDQRNAKLGGDFRRRKSAIFGFAYVARRTELNRIVDDRIDDGVDVLGRDEPSVFAFENGTYDVACFVSPERASGAEIIEDEVRQTVARTARSERRAVFRIC